MRFAPTKQRPNLKPIYGFDIETYDNNKKFLMASLYFDDKNKWFFYHKRDLIDFFKKHRFRNSIISATNLGFDFHGTFFNEPESANFRMLYRGSDLLCASTYFNRKKSGFVISSKEGMAKLTFIDTMNYAHLSVEKLGKLINIDKLDTPKFLGRYPKNETEWKIMSEYNMRDSIISKKALEFLYNSFYNLGATPKSTIASTSMSLFRNKYLNNTFYRHDTNLLLEQFNAYYGGRTEAFNRGTIHDYNYYDVNSLYPNVMMNEFPNPNTVRTNYKNSLKYIKNYEGISLTTVELSPQLCKDTLSDYPLLPYRKDNKLLFPVGTWQAWYSHIELRKALELGYEIKKVHRSIYFKETCRPFKPFVEHLYDLRKEYKKDKSPMEFVVKILLNSLYGKFAQKFTDRDSWMHKDSATKEFLSKQKFIERVGDYFRLKKAFTRPACFCFPIWSLYVSAYGRLKLHDYILKSNPVYVDTDSIITKKELETSSKIGKLKLEMRIKEGVIIKPKFYMIIPYNQKAYIKIKGVGAKLVMSDFYKLMLSPRVKYTKFMKFKESVRRGFIPNEIQDIVKVLDLEDNKRIWGRLLDINVQQDSKPITMYPDKISPLYETLQNEKSSHRPSLDATA